MTIEIPLTKGKVAIIDECDRELIEARKWCAISPKGYWYAVASRPRPRTNGAHFSMHRVITNAKPGQLVDHRDGDGMNNTRSNLRIASYAENTWNSRKQSNNTSGFIGVGLEPNTGRWFAKIKQHGQLIFIGAFATPVDAAIAFDLKAIELRGEFAKTNFPIEGY